MKFEVQGGNIKDIVNNPKLTLFVGIFSDQLELSPHIKDDSVRNVFQSMVESGELTGESDVVTLLTTLPPNRKYFVVGLGKKSELNMESIRVGASAMVRHLRKSKISEAVFIFPDISSTKLTLEDAGQSFAEGAILRNYFFSKYSQANYVKEWDVHNITIYDDRDDVREAILKGIKRGQIFAEATNFCRDLGNEPANKMTPTIMALEAEKMCQKYGLKCKVLSEDEMKDLGMNLLLAVAGSKSTPPKLIVIEYYSDKPNARTLGLVGKGVTFDSGGISLKPATDMHLMKRDMCGGAAVIATMQIMAQIKPGVNVIGVVPAVENMPGSQATKPGDIFRSMSGKTVEITNTDAEGRLILADALTYIQKNYKLDFLVDIATLTGAMVRAIGESITGVFTNNPGFLAQLQMASERSNEKIWEFPIAQTYHKRVESRFADLRNSSDKGPGAIVGALFLNEFVAPSLPWIHMDIAGTNSVSGEPRKYFPRGSTGVGTRILAELANILAG